MVLAGLAEADFYDSLSNVKPVKLLDRSKSFPQKPGVYLFRDAKKQVIYVGKAKNLRSRVVSYFRKGRDERPQIEFLVKRTKDVEFVVTNTEKEALLLENTLIKRHKPRYNLLLKDDKNFASIKLTAAQKFPGIYLTRHVRKDGALYFGPYDSSVAAREAIEQITRFFKLRTCSDTEFANRVRPCLKFDIARCTAPCVGLVSKEEYERQIEDSRMFLAGKSADLIKRLKVKMDDASTNMRYEDAATLRDAISMLKGMREKQKAVVHGGGDLDAVGLSAKDGMASICVIVVRSGTIIDRKLFFSPIIPRDESKLVEEFVLQRYVDKAGIPPKIFLSVKPEGLGEIRKIICDRRRGRVSISRPKRGEGLGLVGLAEENAREALAARMLRKGEGRVFESLARKLRVPGTFEDIECVDISNLSGKEAVGSIVSFSNGEPQKSNYRIYNVRSLQTPDDYGMMHEVLSRRLESVSRPLPDLLLVDGGKGQLAVALKVLEELGASLPVAAIAKAKGTKEVDRVYVPGRKNPVNLKKGSKELLFLMRVRDEAHRFGLNAHRKLRGKKAIS